MTWNDGSSAYCCGSSVSMSNCAMRRTLAGSAAPAANAIEQATTAKQRAPRERDGVRAGDRELRRRRWNGVGIRISIQPSARARAPARARRGSARAAARRATGRRSGAGSSCRRRRSAYPAPPRGRPASARAPPCAPRRRSARHRNRSCPPCRSSSIRRARRARSGTRPQHRLRRRHRIERLLVAVRVQERAASAAAARGAAPGAARAVLAREELLDQERAAPRGAARPRRGPSPGTRRASRGGTTARGRRSAAPRATCGAQRGDDAASFDLRLVDEAGGEIRAAAAQRPRRLAHRRRRSRDVHAVACGAQHVHRRARVLGLEIVGERVDEEHDVGILAGIAGARAARRAGTCRRATRAAIAAPRSRATLR